MTILDWSFGWASIDLDKARAVADGVVRYGGGSPGPSVTAEQITAIRAKDFDLGFVWETSANRAEDGYQAGRDDALAFNAFLDSLGVPNTVTAFYADDADPRRNLPAVSSYYKGTASTTGRAAGGYVGDYAGVPLLDDGVLTKLWLPGATSWSYDANNPRANMIQRVGTPWDLGGSYDYSDVITPEWGQWHRPSHDTPTPPAIVESMIITGVRNSGPTSGAIESWLCVGHVPVQQVDPVNYPTLVPVPVDPGVIDLLSKIAHTGQADDPAPEVDVLGGVKGYFKSVFPVKARKL